MSNWIKRKKTKTIKVGDVSVGGSNPISVQSMTNTDTCDVLSTVKQINDLEFAGADIVRVSVPGFDEAKAFKEIKSAVDIPLVADIHFTPVAAEIAARIVEKVRVNPGNYADKKNIGVWVKKRKIAAIGVRVSRWVAYNGFSINIENNLNDYKKIKPCGLDNKKVTSIKNEKKILIGIKKNLKKVILQNFLKI